MTRGGANLKGRIPLHELASRRDGEEWVVGQPDTGGIHGTHGIVGHDLGGANQRKQRSGDVSLTEPGA